MKVILRKDVAKVGRKGEVKEVSDGYAQNFLINRGLADIATPTKIAQVRKHAEHAEYERTAEIHTLTEALEHNDAARIAAKANEQGHLFEGVHEKALAEALTKTLGISVDEHMIELDAPIKEVGEYHFVVKVGGKKLPASVVVESA